jgi:hypothetical protein
MRLWDITRRSKMSQYIFAIGFSSGKSFEVGVDASNYKEARKKVYNSLSDEAKDNIEDIELIEEN